MLFRSAYLNKEGFTAVAYHGGMNSIHRSKNQEAFLKGRVPWMVATSAFGMGIHKEDLRTIIHYHLPASIEQYIQECGRAGRDNQSARCLMLFSIADRRIHEALMIRAQPSLSDITLLLKLIYSKNQNWETTESELLNLIETESHNHQPLLWNDKSLQKYMSILEEYGWVQWLRDRGIWTITKLPSPPSTEEITGRLNDRMSDSFSRLNTMEKFGTHQGCLRRFLANELDGPAIVECNNCSGCTGAFKIKIDANNPIVQTILDFVKKYPEHTQLSTITWVLSGSKSRIVRQNKLDHFQYYGELKTFSQLEIREVAKSLFYAGKIQRNNELKSIQLATA